jgi:RimJ/RimL family protein N-acetyltransferase
MSENVTLRNVEDGDLEILYQQQLDPDAVKMRAFPSSEREPYMAHWAKVLTNDSNVLRIIVANDKVVGSMMSWAQDGKRQVGFGLGKDYWGRGIATKALAAFLDELSERPLYGYAAGHNIGSQRVMEKCGFVKVGVDRGVLEVDGELIDEMVFELK